MFGAKMHQTGASFALADLQPTMRMTEADATGRVGAAGRRAGADIVVGRRPNTTPRSRTAARSTPATRQFAARKALMLFDNVFVP